MKPSQPTWDTRRPPSVCVGWVVWSKGLNLWLRVGYRAGQTIAQRWTRNPWHAALWDYPQQAASAMAAIHSRGVEAVELNLEPMLGPHYLIVREGDPVDYYGILIDNSHGMTSDITRAFRFLTESAACRYCPPHTAPQLHVGYCPLVRLL